MSTTELMAAGQVRADALVRLGGAELEAALRLPEQEFPPLTTLSYEGPLRLAPMPDLMTLGIVGARRYR